MSAHGAFSPQLVNQVIDELGEAYHWDRDRFPHFTRPCDSYKALRTCTLVSKRWLARSRVHLFRRVKIDGAKYEPTIDIPPASILPYIKELEIYYDYQPTQATSIANVLQAFTAAPIECLEITGGVLDDKRACIQESVDAHSATLQTVEFQSCSLSAYNIADILLGHHRLRNLRLVDCKCEKLPPPGQPLIADTPDPGSKVVELELHISGGDIWEGPACIVTMVARLPYRFSRLDIDHLVAGEGTTEATNALVKANADVLSFLRVHFIAEDMEVDIEPEHLFSLEGCSNLSELTLDMERSESCAVQDSISVLSTLDPARLNHLGKIVLKYNYVGQWFNEDGPAARRGTRADSEDDQTGSEDDQANSEDWEGLDIVLTNLANAYISTKKKRLTFTMVVLRWCDDGKVVSTVRKWLPKMLPRFNELGLLHVHYERGNRCRAIDDSCLRHDKPECLGEDFQDGF